MNQYSTYRIQHVYSNTNFKLFDFVHINKSIRVLCVCVCGSLYMCGLHFCVETFHSLRTTNVAFKCWWETKTSAFSGHLCGILFSVLNCVQISLSLVWHIFYTCWSNNKHVSKVSIWLFFFFTWWKCQPSHWQKACLVNQGTIQAVCRSQGEMPSLLMQLLNENSPLALFPPLLFSFSDIIHFFQFCPLFLCLLQHKQSKRHWFENCEAYHFTDNL